MICAESFNFELCWQMYNLACEYAQSLNLQILDVYGSSSSIGSEGGTSDGDRKSFSELLQIDLFIQLVFDKPPRITATTWKVNMPWFEPRLTTPGKGRDYAVFMRFSDYSHFDEVPFHVGRSGK